MLYLLVVVFWYTMFFLVAISTLLWSAYVGGMVLWIAFWMFGETTIPECRLLGKGLVHWYYPMLCNAILLYTILYVWPSVSTFMPEG